MSLKKTSKNILGISIKVSIYALLLTLLIILSTKGYNFGKNLFSDRGFDASPGIDATITIDSDESVMSVAAKLVDKGIIKDRYIFYFQNLMYEGDFKSGTYTVNSSLNGEDLIELLSEGTTGEATNGTQEETTQETTEGN